MQVIEADNTNDMASLVYDKLQIDGVEADSRNGKVLKFPTPVTFVYNKPWERANLCEYRDCNPFFHVMEALAMLANLNSVAFMTYFNKQMKAYSDNGIDYNAFYGERMMSAYGDQLSACIVQLRSDPYTRAAVIQLWTPADLVTSSVDRACNLSMVFNTRPNGCLDMTVFNRSNDLVWGGVTGANIVHFSMFHEIVARGASLAIGKMYHVVNDAHVYVDNPVFQRLKKNGSNRGPHYSIFNTVQVGREYASFMEESYSLVTSLHLHGFKYISPNLYTDPFVADVAIPMYNAWHARKLKDNELMWDWIHKIKDEAWNYVCVKWVKRRDEDVSE
jgi:thymidylate synthase